MRTLAFVAGFVTVVLSSPTAQADSLAATRSQPLQETAHSVRLKVRRGVARYVVQRSFHNAGKRHEEARLRIDMPVGAAATGLRIRVGDDWFSGELMRRERAAALYEKFTGIGPHLPKDPALLWWEWADRLRLNVFPIAPNTTSTVEYTLTAPTRYRDGRYFVSYPMTGDSDNLLAPTLSVIGKRGVVVDGHKLAKMEPLALVVKPKPAWLTQHQPSASASYVSSTLMVEDTLQVKSIEVNFNVNHTYRGDLLVELRTPNGQWHTLHDRGGGGDNDVRVKKTLDLGESTATKGPWRLVISDHAGLDVGSLDSWSLTVADGERKRTFQAPDTPMFLPDAPGNNAQGHATISMLAPVVRPLAGRLGRVPAGENKEVSRLEIDVAKPLRPKPKKLSVVFVVDASHSIRQHGIDSQIEIARSFLKHVPDASFDVVVYRRAAHRIVGHLAAAAEFDSWIDKARRADKLTPDNGSALDAGLILAAQALAKVPAPRTIVALNDDLLRPSWHNRLGLNALKKISKDTIVHLAISNFFDGQLSDKRADSHPLSIIAARRGGVLLRLQGSPFTDEKALDTTTLGLVRPVRIDNFTIKGVKFVDADIGSTLEEGVGIREMAIVEHAPVEVTLSGKIWAKRYRKKVRSTVPFSRATAAYLFSHDMYGELSEEEQFRVAMIGRAVSPVTSYLAIEPGVRPSKVGLEGGQGGSGMLGSGFGSAHGSLGRVPPSPDFRALLADDVARCKQQHHPAKGWAAALTIHTTFHEIVDVVEDGAAGPMQDCIAEAAWRLQLGDGNHTERRSASLTWR